ncbi:MAG: hypothetical protein ACREPZ_01035 [Rhodanobacteraceae bacterium]
MQNRSDSLRNKLMVACALVTVAILATPAAMARDHYRNSNDTAKVVGALVVGAVIGGVLASSSHHDNYYRGGYNYPAQAYPSNYYGSYPAYSYNSYPAYSYNSYPAYSYNSYPSYGSNYYAPAPRYGSGVRVGVVYSSHGDRSRNYRGHSQGYRSHGDRSHDNRGGHGHYYRGH